MKILVTGYPGQLAMCLVDYLKEMDLEYETRSVGELDITDREQIERDLSTGNFGYLINCAAYTNVAKAEEEPEVARAINGDALIDISELCAKYNVTLIHISTDYVFDGRHRNSPYKEDDFATPLNIYGATKLFGENNIRICHEDNPNFHYAIIRTAWLYSEYGNNFVRTIVNKLLNSENFEVVCDQYGSPTYAGDLAKFIVDELIFSNFESGTYHYTNEGMCSWYDFACGIALIYQTIMNENGVIVGVNINPVMTDIECQNVVRPLYSVLSKEKVRNKFQTFIPHWLSTLNHMLRSYIRFEKKN